MVLQGGGTRRSRSDMLLWGIIPAVLFDEREMMVPKEGQRAKNVTGVVKGNLTK